MPTFTENVSSAYNQIFGQGTTLSNGGIVFPKDLSGNYCIYLHFYKYNRPSVAQGSNASIDPIEVIALPLPAGLVDSQSIDYSEEPLGPALGGTMEALQGWNVSAFVTGIAVGGASGAGQALGVGGAVSAGLGVTANPFMTVLFKSPKYRTYELAWRFFPRNKDESESLKLIYRNIKYHSLPTKISGTGGTLLGYPDMIKPVIIANGNEWMMPYKYGVITNVTFNFAPDNVPSFHKGGQPTAVDLRLQIQEIEYFFRDDYAGIT